MTDLAVVVWGLGAHALKNILPALRETSGIRLYGVCSRSPNVVKDTARAWACEGFLEPGRMLADPAVDAVYLSTPIGVHATQGLSVLHAGKHLWCEKPLAGSAAEAHDVLELARARGLAVGEAFMYLYHPHFAWVSEVVRDGRLGQILRVGCRFGIPPLERPGFRLTAALGGGAFLDVGSYPVSAVVALFPDLEPRVLHASIATAPGTPVDSSGDALVSFGTVRATLEWGTHCAYRNEIDVWGTEGSAMSERIFSKPADYVPGIRFLDRHGRERVESGGARNHFTSMLEAFRDLARDPASAERERACIERRARLMDAIRERAAA